MRSDEVADRAVRVALVAQAVLLLALVARMLTRPLWFNEQWRAFHLTMPGMPWVPRADTNAPMSFGYAVVEMVSTGVFGRHEWALRLPSAIAFVLLPVLTYRLARRFVPPLAAGLTVAALLLSRLVLTYGAELAPYTIEAAATVGALLLWFRSWDNDVTVRGVWARYAGITALCLLATPLVLVLAPLLVVDLVRAAELRDRQPVGPAVFAGGIALLHLMTYVGRQSLQTRGPYWQEQFLPRDVGVVAGVWRGLASWVPNALTGSTAHVPSVPDGTIPLPLVVRVAVGVVIVAAVVAGVAHALRDPEAAPLPVVLAGGVAGQVAGSLAHAWPFGFTRVNTFLLPVAYVLAAVGATRAVRAARGRFARRRLRVAGMAAYALVLVVGALQVATVRREAPGPAYGTGLSLFADTVRARAGDGDVLVLMHPMAIKGWGWYTGRVDDPGVTPERTLRLGAAAPDLAALRAFLARHADASRVYVLALRGSDPAAVGAVVGAVRSSGYRHGPTWRDPWTGGLRELPRREPPERWLAT